MKKLIKEVEGEGLVNLLGKRITVFCVNYIYTGDLIGVNTDDILLENPAIVYETGGFSDKNWQDAQALPGSLYIRTSAIESYTIIR